MPPFALPRLAQGVGRSRKTFRRRWPTDSAYQNARKNSDKQNVRIEHDKALARVMTAVLKDHRPIAAATMRASCATSGMPYGVPIADAFAPCPSQARARHHWVEVAVSSPVAMH